MDLGSLKLAAEMQLNRQQLSPATTLKDVLTKLKLTAKADTRSNDYTQAVELCKKHKLPVVLLDGCIIFYYPKDGLKRNYLNWPADSLPPLDEHTSDDFLVAVLRRVFAEKDRNGDDRDTKVVVGFKFRADQEITSSSKVHPELIPPLQGGAALHDCTLQCFWDATGMQRAVPPLHVPPVHSPMRRKRISGRSSSQRSRPGLQQPAAPSDCGPPWRSIIACRAGSSPSSQCNSLAQGKSETSRRRTSSGCPRSSSRCTTASRTR